MAQATKGFKLFQYADEVVKFKAGQTIFEEGDTSPGMFVVKSGRAQLRVTNGITEPLEPGSILGEMSLVDNSPRSATAAALTDCELVPINEKKFEFLIQRTPYFALEVLRVMCRRMRRMNRETMALPTSNLRGSGTEIMPADILEIQTHWNSLPEEVRSSVMSIIREMAKARRPRPARKESKRQA